AIISGTVDPETGAFHFAGNISIAGTSTSFDLSGNVPLSAGATGSVSVSVNGQTFTGTIGSGVGPTPLPTQSGGPTATPGSGSSCANGVLSSTITNVVGSNVDAQPHTMGNLTA